MFKDFVCKHVYKKLEKNLRKFTLRTSLEQGQGIYIYIYTDISCQENLPPPPQTIPTSILLHIFVGSKKNNQKFLATRSLHDTSQGICCCHVSVAELVSIASTFGTVTSTGGVVLRVTAKKLVGDDTHNSPFHQDLKPREMQLFLGSHHHRHLFHQGLSCPRWPGCRAK